MDNHSNEKKYVPLPHKTYKKSLSAFKRGLDDMDNPKPRNRVAIFAGTAAIGLGILLTFALIPTLDNQDIPSDSVEVEKEDSKEETTEEQAFNPQNIEVDEDLLSEVFVREPIEPASSSADQSFHNGLFQAHIPDGWSLSNENLSHDHGTKAVLNGPAGIQQTILVFDEEATQEEINQAKEELISTYRYTKATKVPIEDLKEYKANHDVTVGRVMEKFIDRFSIELNDETTFVTMINEQENQLYDYTETDLFGKKMVFFSEVDLDRHGQRAASYFTLSSLSPNGDYVAFQGPYEQTHGRPSTLTLVTGIFKWYFVDLHLYEHELGFTSYIKEGTTVEKINRQGFTEWKFNDEFTTENRYYSFGKLDPSIPLEDAKMTLIEGYGLDPNYIDGSSQTLFSHRSNRDTSNEMLRQFELVQKQGEWYYIFTLNDFNGYGDRNGPSIWSLVNKFQQEIIFD